MIDVIPFSTEKMYQTNSKYIVLQKRGAALEGVNVKLTLQDCRMAKRSNKNIDPEKGLPGARAVWLHPFR